MNDQDNKDEYQFTDMEGFNEDYNSDQPNPSETTEISKKNFILELLQDEENKEILKKAGIGLGAVLLVVMLYNTFTAKKITPAVSSMPSIPTSNIPSPAVPQNNYQETRMINQLSGAQQNLISKLDDANNQISNLQSQLSNYQATISALKVSLEETKALQQQQMQTMETMAQDLNQLKMIQDSFVKRSTKGGYFVQAIVPGRAWLQGPDGHTMTVGVGSMIPGYGEVVDISPQDGIVKTRSGKIIALSQQDS